MAKMCLTLVQVVSVFSLLLAQAHSFNFLKAIYPGTQWCGRSNRASGYDDLGRLKGLDTCCRQHDLCPDKIRPGQRNGGLKNNGFSPLFHCRCENQFKQCLYSNPGLHSTIMGLSYFNVLKKGCYVDADDTGPSVQFKYMKMKSFKPCFKSSFLRTITGSTC